MIFLCTPPRFIVHCRVAEVAREHGWHPPKSLDSDVFREALQKSGVNIKPILLRLKDRQKSAIDRN